jgi:outer membrane translocation and assembly module TamA
LELRTPITSVLSGAKLGFTVFADAAKVADEGFDLRDARWNKGAGAGLFLIASIIKINLDVARQLRSDGDIRVHLSSGFSF